MEYIFTKKTDGICTLTLSRPKALNALNIAMLKELEIVVSDIEKDESIKVLIITGAGEKAFIAGADISEMMNFDKQQAKEFSQLGNGIFRRIEKLGIPVIAAVSGYALGGGCELCMCADIRVASEDSVFGQPEAALGITPGFGGTQRLSRIVGLSKAKELMFTCSNIKADEALSIGLVNHVVKKEELSDVVEKLAEKMAKMPLIALKMCKQAANEGFEQDMDTAIETEEDLFSDCFLTDDPKTLMQAFLSRSKK